MYQTIYIDKLTFLCAQDNMQTTCIHRHKHTHLTWMKCDTSQWKRSWHTERKKKNLTQASYTHGPMHMCVLTETPWFPAGGRACEPLLKLSCQIPSTSLSISILSLHSATLFLYLSVAHTHTDTLRKTLVGSCTQTHPQKTHAHTLPHACMVFSRHDYIRSIFFACCVSEALKSINCNTQATSLQRFALGQLPSFSLVHTNGLSLQSVFVVICVWIPTCVCVCMFVCTQGWLPLLKASAAWTCMDNMWVSVCRIFTLTH